MGEARATSQVAERAGTGVPRPNVSGPTQGSLQAQPWRLLVTQNLPWKHNTYVEQEREGGLVAPPTRPLRVPR